MKYMPYLVSAIAGFALGGMVRWYCYPWTDLVSSREMFFVTVLIGVPSGFVLQIIAVRYPPQSRLLDIRFFVCLGIVCSLIW